MQEIYQDRKKFSEHVFKVASSDLVNMGIGVVSYTLKDVHDDQVRHVCLCHYSWQKSDGQDNKIIGAAGSCVSASFSYESF